MMHGREKSDPSMVAAKPANEGGHPPEELVEPRETRDSLPHTELRVGQVCPMGWIVYGKQRKTGKGNPSPPCFTISMSNCFGQPMAGCGKKRRRVWMG